MSRYTGTAYRGCKKKDTRPDLILHGVDKNNKEIIEEVKVDNLMKKLIAEDRIHKSSGTPPSTSGVRLHRKNCRNPKLGIQNPALVIQLISSSFIGFAL